MFSFVPIVQKLLDGISFPFPFSFTKRWVPRWKKRNKNFRFFTFSFFFWLATKKNASRFPPKNEKWQHISWCLRKGEGKSISFTTNKKAYRVSNLLKANDGRWKSPSRWQLFVWFSLRFFFARSFPDAFWFSMTKLSPSWFPPIVEQFFFGCMS